jgi:NRAMP (natural resistance-associated macrophage protein)-like metal ion transporter
LSRLVPTHRTWRKRHKPGHLLGPGLVTGASDDDPSGIATYSQAGAKFGNGLLWTMVFTYPLMCAIQEISARIGRVTGHGVAGNLRRHYPAWIVRPCIGLFVAANVVNLGADIAAMGAAVHLLVGGPTLLYSAAFVVVSLALQIRFPYSTYAKVLKLLTLSLLAYVATLFVVDVPWRDVAQGLVPRLAWHNDSIAMVVAVFGTTISPYLFFWQASEEVEETQTNHHEEPLKQAPRQAKRQLHRIRLDTLVGMGASNLIAAFIIVTCAVTLHANGITDIRSADQAAQALRPVAGDAATTLFAIGIIGTGLLALPILGGSAAYAIGETMKWTVGLDRRFGQARGFYLVLSAATLLGLAMNVVGVSPVRALIYAAIVNGIVAPPLMAVMVLAASNPRVMGRFTLSGGLRVLGWSVVGAMTLAAGAFLATGLG